MKPRTKFLIGGAVVLGVAGYLMATSIKDTGMYYMTPTEPFNLLVKISLVASVFLSAPFLMAQVWLFIAPGLYKRERRYALPFIISSSILAVVTPGRSDPRAADASDSASRTRSWTGFPITV